MAITVGNCLVRLVLLVAFLCTPKITLQTLTCTYSPGSSSHVLRKSKLLTLFNTK